MDTLNTNETPMGYVYMIQFFGPTVRGRRKTPTFLKIGSTRNPIMRLADHYYKGFANKFINIKRIAFCDNYLQCEVDIKNCFDCKEIIPFSEQNERFINRIIDNYVIDDLDINTMGFLITTEALERYFQKHVQD